MRLFFLFVLLIAVLSCSTQPLSEQEIIEHGKSEVLKMLEREYGDRLGDSCRFEIKNGDAFIEFNMLIVKVLLACDGSPFSIAGNKYYRFNINWDAESVDKSLTLED